MFDGYALLALTPVIGLAADCLVHVLLCWVFGRSSYFLPLLVGLLAGLVATIAVSCAACACMKAGMADVMAFLAMNGCAYVGLAYGYFNFVNINLASLRIRMLDELAAVGGQMSRAELLARYNTGSVIELRIDRLTQWQNLVEHQGRYYNGKAWFLLLARFFDLLRWFILGRNCPPDGRQEAGS